MPLGLGLLPCPRSTPGRHVQHYRAPRSGMNVILKSIGEETRNGIAKPIDVLLLQEQTNPAPGPNSPSPSTQQFVNLLNGIYNDPNITYAMGNRTGAGDTTQTIVYRTQTIQTIQSADEVAISSSSGPRQTLRYRVRPVGYSTTAADLYLYDSHYKASLDMTPPGSNANKRLSEATAIRANSDFLGEGISVVYAGDHNFYYSDSREPAWDTLTAAGPGQTNDPLNRVGNWHSNSSFADVHTQSPCNSSCPLVGGGMDDRFDFQLVTGELLDGEGLSYIGPTSVGMNGLEHSYHAFGNNGSTYNGNINSASNTVSLSGVTSYTKSQILDALWNASDHLPVVADYQVPAIMQAIADSVPTSIDLGQVYNVGVTVTNTANVVAAIGADELDYSLSTSDSLSGSYSNQVDLAGDLLGNVYMVGLDTSTTGIKSGMITVTSTSQGVENGTIEIPVSFLVVLPGDYNGNGIVDAADYSEWRATQGQLVTAGTGADGSRDGLIGPEDYAIWRSHFGESADGAGAAFTGAAVPEPGALVLMLCAVCLCGVRTTKLRTWTRKS